MEILSDNKQIPVASVQGQTNWNRMSNVTENNTELARFRSYPCCCLTRGGPVLVTLRKQVAFLDMRKLVQYGVHYVCFLAIFTQIFEF
jgi:hypothetical protein